jgi:hypothetical protein
LTTSGFRLPGEAQRIDRLMSTFSRCFFEDNAGCPEECPFQNQDTVFLLVFAIIMLNTDLHKVAHRTRRSKKMTKADFINNLRGVENGHDIDFEYLASVYDAIQADPIVMNDSCESDISQNDRDVKVEAMLSNVRAADSLLRGVAVHDFKFATIEDFTASFEYSGMDALSDLTRSCVSKTWHQWHGVINTGMEASQLDPQGMEPSVVILLYALSVTICLNMPTERSAFLSQLGRLREFEEQRQGRWVSAPIIDYREETWFKEIEKACVGSDEQKLWALRKIQGWIHSLQSTLSVDVKNKIEMTRAVAEIKNSDFLLRDPTRTFLRSGELIKKSARTGRSTKYRFYLFSDVLLYSKESNGLYKIHEELPLHLMKILDWFPLSQRNRLCMFEVLHPRKKFQVVCPSEDDRKSWVQAIRGAVHQQVERKMKTEASRLSLYAHMQE